MGAAGSRGAHFAEKLGRPAIGRSFCCKSALQALHSKGLGAIGKGKTRAKRKPPRLKTQSFRTNLKGVET
ncbi:hypothetical protein ACU4I5_07990 [Ensifer adhaerens]